jgi:stress response protein SCP2
MKELIRGQRARLIDLGIDGPFEAEVVVDIPGVEVDVCAFGLDRAERLSDDRYMVFDNQPQSPCGAVRLLAQRNEATRFRIDLPGLPAAIERLAIAAVTTSVPLRQCRACELALSMGGEVRARFVLPPAQLAEERALIVAEVYPKDGQWRLCATGQGFDGGLEALVRHFGGTVEEIASTPAPAPPVVVPEGSRVSLEKKVAKAPHLVSLAKTAETTLLAYRLTKVVARVALVLDASGSMNWQYAKGRIQELIDRMVPLALHFDDDGTLECWAYASRVRALPAATVENCRRYVDEADGGWRRWMKEVRPLTNNEPTVIAAIVAALGASPLPVYVLFVTDGGVTKNREIARLIVDAARLPIFWQFVGIGGRDYGILERLDTMQGRLVDNAGFFSIDDLQTVAAQDFYDRLLREFPQWLDAARRASVIG